MVKSKKIRLLLAESSSLISSPIGLESSSSLPSSSYKKSHRTVKSKCNICGIAFTDLDDLKWHKDTNHKILNDSPSTLSTIRKSSRIKARAERKAKSVKPIRLEEVHSSDIAVNKNRETSHKNRTQINSKKYPVVKSLLFCNHCEYSCRRKTVMSKHIQTYHPSNPMVQNVELNRSLLSCAICLRTFRRKANLRKHVFSHDLSNSKADDEVNTNADTKLKKGYCCNICNRGFFHYRDMLAHRDVAHDTAVALEWMQFCGSTSALKYCKVCGKYFKDDERFLEHECKKGDSKEVVEKIEQLLKSSPRYKCDVCSMCFHWKWMYRLHRENVHRIAAPFDWKTLCKSEIQFYCQSCMEAFADKETLTKHTSSCVVNRENTMKTFICSLCNRSFMRKPDFQRHLRNKHPESGITDVKKVVPKKKSPIQCPYCDVQMMTRGEILKHAKDMHDVVMDTPFVCVACNKIFKRKETMEMHNQIYHPKEENTEENDKIIKEAEFLLNGETAYHCTICKRNLQDSFKYIAHYRLHKLERKFTCDLCGKQTRTQHQLNTHIKFIHLNIRNFQCDLCEKSFHSKQSCEEHRRTHTGERPFSCEICGKTFIALNALFTHKKFHNDFFAHPCTMCPKKFKVRRSLINHIRTHTGERPFKCELCPKTFNNSSRFSYHKKVTHSDNRPFKCAECGSCFKANKFLMRHMKLHAIRTRIQFRRRNNPAYFETHDTNPPKQSAPSKMQINSKQSFIVKVVTSSKPDEVKNSSELVPALHAAYRGVENILIDDDLSFVDMNEVLDDQDTKNHFLPEEFGDCSN